MRLLDCSEGSDILKMLHNLEAAQGGKTGDVHDDLEGWGVF
jgi:hypothetical protein